MTPKSCANLAFPTRVLGVKWAYSFDGDVNNTDQLRMQFKADRITPYPKF